MDRVLVWHVCFGETVIGCWDQGMIRVSKSDRLLVPCRFIPDNFKLDIKVGYAGGFTQQGINVILEA